MYSFTWTLFFRNQKVVVKTRFWYYCKGFITNSSTLFSFSDLCHYRRTISSNLASTHEPNHSRLLNAWGSEFQTSRACWHFAERRNMFSVYSFLFSVEARFWLYVILSDNRKPSEKCKEAQCVLSMSKYGVFHTSDESWHFISKNFHSNRISVSKLIPNRKYSYWMYFS